MTTPTWTPTPVADLETPEALLARFTDNVSGDIGADDLRALTQQLLSRLHWAEQAVVRSRAGLPGVAPPVSPPRF